MQADLLVGDVVRRMAASRGDSVAVECDGRALTFAELDESSNRLAQALLAEGVGPTTRVAYLDRTAPECIELLFAAAKVGAVLVPLNWRLAPPELEVVMRDAQASLLVAGPEYAKVARRLAERSVIVGDEYERWMRAHDATDPGHRARPDEVVLQMYTSGTTGLPKGVLTTHRNLAAAAASARPWMFDGDSVSVTPLPMFHVGGVGWTYVGLSVGAATHLVRDFDPAAVLDLLEQRGVTNAVFVPTILQLLTSVPDACDRDYSALRSIAYGGSPITTLVLKAALRTFRCSLFGVYGLTETTGGVVVLAPTDHDPDGPREHLLRSAGRPYPWVDMEVVDVRTGERCAPGQVGEVRLRGPNVCRGYYGRPSETEAAITLDGWLRTGDGGYVDEEGYLFLTDRIKDMIVTGGENVYPAEVEEALSLHPDVLAAAVVGVPDDRWAEAVTAFVVLRDGAGVSGEDLRSFARGRLAGYKVPRTVEFRDELPRNATGKVLKAELRGSTARRPRAGSPAGTG